MCDSGENKGVKKEKKSGCYGYRRLHVPGEGHRKSRAAWVREKGEKSASWGAKPGKQGNLGGAGRSQRLGEAPQ